MATAQVTGQVWHPAYSIHTVAMRRRLACCAIISMFVLCGCQSARAQTEGSTRLSEPTMSSPSPVVQAPNPSDAPRYQMYDPF